MSTDKNTGSNKMHNSIENGGIFSRTTIMKLINIKQYI